MLQIGGFYAYYLKGSVIPFISINDCRKTLKINYTSIFTEDVKFQKHIDIISAICKKEAEFQKMLSKIADLKVSYVQSLFKKKQNKAI